MTKIKKLYALLFIMGTTLACAFVENIVLPPPTIDSYPLQQQEDPAPEILSVPEPLLCSDDKCLNACIERLDYVLETRPFAPIGNPIYEEQNANFNLVIYKVMGDEITNPSVLYVPPDYRKYQEDTTSHFHIWDFYVAIIPLELRKMVNEFVIFTDGGGGNAGAWVSQSIKDPNYWQVGFDLLDSDYPLFLADALVHETGHLITLNTSQIPYDEDHFYMYDSRRNIVPGCDQYAVSGNCSLQDSYINLFYQKFWKDIFPEWWEVNQQSEKAESYEEYRQIMEVFYNNHERLFINSYSAINIKEDMAESFSFFVLNPKPIDNTGFNQKVNFFYEFPELIEYRKQIIEGLCSYLK